MASRTVVPDPEHVFPLPFYGGFATHTVAAFLVRHHNGPGCDDTFTCHAADDGRWLGYGETKDDAVSDAQMGLAPVAEQMAFEAGRIDRPYGKLIRSAVAL